jgi:hypothetical protein
MKVDDFLASFQKINIFVRSLVMSGQYLNCKKFILYFCLFSLFLCYNNINYSAEKEQIYD